MRGQELLQALRAALLVTTLGLCGITATPGSGFFGSKTLDFTAETEKILGETKKHLRESSEGARCFGLLGSHSARNAGTPWGIHSLDA